MKFKLMAIIGICSSLLLSGCSNEEKSVVDKETSHEGHSAHTVSGDLQEETSSKEIAPEFLSGKPEEMKTIYLAVAQNQELLENIPCYCGCGEEANHKNNYDCFIHENKKSGEVVWDDHGTRCGVCLEIAAQSILDLRDGMTIKDIRTKVDEKYKSGYAKPTPTPEV
ncbi:PCYCGC motif-containing (lipo)protein [Peribacillus butanolivorans]|uniref:PCYCGC motif-containing (lipo)protein n=1 Tax=Peribacillus butanolivorans TaxID=421767 RepID=UPI002E235244|nr:PCYCGC motif-containing (lipo)protein [Peribacillus butanolivorans]